MLFKWITGARGSEDRELYDLNICVVENDSLFIFNTNNIKPTWISHSFNYIFTISYGHANVCQFKWSVLYVINLNTYYFKRYTENKSNFRPALNPGSDATQFSCLHAPHQHGRFQEHRGWKEFSCSFNEIVSRYCTMLLYVSVSVGSYK